MTLAADARPPAAPLPAGGALASELSAQMLAAFPRLDPARPETWAELLRPLDLWRVAPWVRFALDEPGRIVLASDGVAEASVVGWLPGQASPVHDHGGSSELFVVLSGAAVEERFARGEDDALTKVEEVPHAVGDESSAAPDTIHRIRNDGAAILVTLHVVLPREGGAARTYAPPT